MIELGRDLAFALILTGETTLSESEQGREGTCGLACRWTGRGQVVQYDNITKSTH